MVCVVDALSRVTWVDGMCGALAEEVLPLSFGQQVQPVQK